MGKIYSPFFYASNWCVLASLSLCSAFASSDDTKPRSEDVPGLAFKSYSVTVQAGDESIGYVEVPNDVGPVVLFIQGTPGSWHAFRSLLNNEKLRSRTYMIAVDRPGFGRSADLGVVPLLRDQSKILAPLLARFAEKSGHKVIVVGHSLGGTIAYQLAADHPEYVFGIVAISASISPVLGKPRWYNRLAAMPIGWLIPDVLEIANEEIMPLSGELARLEPRLTSIAMPVTVIHGDSDKLVASGNVDFAETHLRQADLAIIRRKNEDHFLIWNEPDIVVSAVIAMLDTAQWQSATDAGGSAN